MTLFFNILVVTILVLLVVYVLTSENEPTQTEIDSQEYSNKLKEYYNNK